MPTATPEGDSRIIQIIAMKRKEPVVAGAEELAATSDEHRVRSGYLREMRPGRLFARSIEASAEINAPIEQVWAILTDFAAYPQWNPFTVSVDTRFEPGRPVIMEVALMPPKTMRQVEFINVIEAPRRIAWGYVMGHASILQANRYQILEPLAEGRCRYRTVDYFSGTMVPLMMATMGDRVKAGFEGVARGLKARAESMDYAD